MFPDSGFFEEAASIPADQATFIARYGSFDNSSDVTRLVAAIADIASAAAAFGSPASLKAALVTNPSLLTSNTPPSEIYARIVWLCSQIQTTASTVSFTLDSLALQLQPRSGDAAHRAMLLDQLFNGNAGLVKAALQTATQVSDLRNKLAAFGPRLQADQQSIAATSLANDANQQIGALQGALTRASAQLAEMHKKATGWNPLDRPKPEALAQLQDDLNSRTKLLAARKQFTHDLGDFFPLANNALTAFIDMDSRLALLQDSLTGVASELSEITRISNKDQLSDITWLSKALGLPARITFWKAVTAASQQFMQTSLTSNS